MQSGARAGRAPPRAEPGHSGASCGRRVRVGFVGKDPEQTTLDSLQQRDVQHVPQRVADVPRLDRRRRALLQVCRNRKPITVTVSSFALNQTPSKRLTVELGVGLLNRERRQKVMHRVFVFLRAVVASAGHPDQTHNATSDARQCSSTRRLDCIARGHSQGHGRAPRGSTASPRPCCPNWRTSRRDG